MDKDTMQAMVDGMADQADNERRKHARELDRANKRTLTPEDRNLLLRAANMIEHENVPLYLEFLEKNRRLEVVCGLRDIVKRVESVL